VHVTFPVASTEQVSVPMVISSHESNTNWVETSFDRCSLLERAEV
jgi:hypothetical protein